MNYGDYKQFFVRYHIVNISQEPTNSFIQQYDSRVPYSTTDQRITMSLHKVGFDQLIKTDDVVIELYSLLEQFPEFKKDYEHHLTLLMLK